MAKYRAKPRNIEGMTEEEKSLELTKQWLESCRHIDEEIDHERAVLLHHLMRVEQLETLKKVIDRTIEELREQERGRTE